MTSTICSTRIESRHGGGARGGPVERVGLGIACAEVIHVHQTVPGGVAIHHYSYTKVDITVIF